MKKHFTILFAVVFAIRILVGCVKTAPQYEQTVQQTVAVQQTELPTQQTESTSQQQTEQETEPQRAKRIVIDPGHQRYADMEQEPLGPGSDEMKFRVSGGTAGCVTGLAEYELNLAVSDFLRDELIARGYDVILTHEDADVSMSNAERAEIANDLLADAFIRIHANGSENQSENGALTICMTNANPFNAWLHDSSYALSEAILDAMCEKSGAKRLHVWETDTMTGINYSQVPVTIVEMGFMTNPDEDQLMATAAYQKLLAAGIADGIDRYFEEIP